jgi:response regulator of citrate/malate metabolism
MCLLIVPFIVRRMVCTTIRNNQDEQAMAHSGINKHQVKKAREALVANGVNLSIDDVRVELGNTGSKATIHLYLKELGDENSLNPGTKHAISETLA